MKFLVLALLTGSAYGSMKSEFIAAHNHYRATRGFEEVLWSGKLQKAAQEQADKCTTEKSDTGYGENIYMISGAKPPVFQIVSDWKPTSRYRNFYQSTWLGCAMALCGSARSYVCNYYPGAWGDE